MFPHHLLMIKTEFLIFVMLTQDSKTIGKNTMVNLHFSSFFILRSPQANLPKILPQARSPQTNLPQADYPKADYPQADLPQTDLPQLP
jgi:hypothetical protein